MTDNMVMVTVQCLRNNTVIGVFPIGEAMRMIDQEYGEHTFIWNIEQNEVIAYRNDYKSRFRLALEWSLV